MVRRHGFLAALAVLVLTLGLLWSGAVSAATYSDPQGRFSFTVPDSWVSVPQPAGVTLPPGTQFAVAYVAPALKTNNYQANFNLITATIPAGGTIDQLVSGFISSVAQGPGYQAGPAAQTITLGGQPAAVVQYSLTTSGQTQRYEHVLTMKGGTAYVLTFTADPADFATLLQQGAVVLSSFAFAAAPAAPTTGTAPVAIPAPAAAPAPTVTAPPAPPRTGGGATADFVRRLGDG